MTLQEYIRAAASRLANSHTPFLDVRVFAKQALHLDDGGIILAANRLLTEEERLTLDALVARRAKGEPVAYITGEKEFYGLNFEMAPGVLAPRPDSETLIEAARKRRASMAPLRILDLGTGSGCLLCALLTIFPQASGVGVDLNEQAVQLARSNAGRLGLAARSSFLVGHWSDGLRERFDIVISNPPYIPDGERESLSPDIRDFEDSRALFAGPQGIDAYQRIFAALPALVAPSGLTILELGTGQHHMVASLAEKAFPAAVLETAEDLAGRPRALVIDLSQQKSV